MRLRFFGFLLFFATLAPLPGAERHVILVCIDGFAAYHFDDPALLLPNLRMLAERGARAKSSETVFPSVTHPSHTTLITGVEPRLHGVLANEMTNRETGAKFHASTRPRAEAITVPTLFDAAKKRGMGTAALHWPETWQDPAVDFNLCSRYLPDDSLDPDAIPSSLRDEFRSAGVPIDAYFRWRADGTVKAAVDTVLIDAATYLLRQHRPHFLAIHISATDSAQHTHGPHHPISQAALNQADAHVGQLVRTIATAGLKDRTMIVITADHGFATVEHEVNVRPVFQATGLLEKVSFHGSSWSLFVRLGPGFSPATDQARLDDALRQVKALPGVGSVLNSSEYPQLGYPRFEDNVHVPGQYLILGDVETYPVADAKSPSAGRQKRSRPSHTHGYLPSHPKMYSALIFSGAGVKKGADLGHVRNIDVAPTIAHYLALDSWPMSGQVLREALE